MNPTPLTVVAEIVAKLGKEEELKRQLLALVEPTREEEGFLPYDLHQSTDEPGGSSSMRTGPRARRSTATSPRPTWRRSPPSPAIWWPNRREV